MSALYVHYSRLIVVSSYVALMCVHLPYKPIRFLAYMVYMPNLMGIFLSNAYFAMT